MILTKELLVVNIFYHAYQEKKPVSLQWESKAKPVVGFRRELRLLFTSLLLSPALDSSLGNSSLCWNQSRVSLIFSWCLESKLDPQQLVLPYSRGPFPRTSQGRSKFKYLDLESWGQRPLALSSGASALTMNELLGQRNLETQKGKKGLGSWTLVWG